MKKIVEQISKALVILGWLIYSILLVLFIQAAWASVYENEMRAAMIYGGFVIIMVLGGLIIHYYRKI